MNNLIRDIVVKYYNKLHTNYGGGIINFDTRVNKMEIIKGDINKLKDVLSTMDNELQNLIGKIDAIHIMSGNVNINSSEKVTQLKMRIDKLIGDLNKRVSSHTFEGMITDEELYESVDDTNLGKFKKGLLDSFVLFVKDYNDTIKRLNMYDKNTILDKLDLDLKETLKDIDTFVQYVTPIKMEVKQLLSQLVTLSKPTFDQKDVKILNTTTMKELPLYTKRLNFSKTDVKTDIIDTNKFNTFRDAVENAIKGVDMQKYVDKYISHIKANIDSVDVNIIKLNSDVYTIEKPTSSIIPMAGGNADTISTLNNKITHLGQLIGEIYDDLERVRQLYIRYNNYVIFLLYTTMVQENTTNFIYYTYINRGLLQFYRSILSDILRRFSIDDPKHDAIYFNKYHYFTVKRLYEFTVYLTNILKPMELIDINACTGNVKDSFNVLNHFKDILDSYHEVFQNKVTIYSRVNDWNIKGAYAKVFSGIANEPQIMHVDPAQCPNLKANTSEIKFTEVFDAEEFGDNTNISKYMTLETQISKKKGVMMTTYGYSGIGKTFTLFGTTGRPGLLQATLNGIRGLKAVMFRIYEIYGLGVQYPHYWTRHDIDMSIVPYNITISPQGNLVVNDDRSVTNISDFVEGDTHYIRIDERDIKNVFNNFGDTIDELDKIRKAHGRIRMTPNNPESSRSIIVYEFQNLIDDVLVPMIIVDLPGREEIVQTYVDDYLKRPFAKKYDTPFHRALLSSLAINPLYLAILVPSMIFETFNNLSNEDRKSLTEIMAMDSMKNKTTDNVENEEEVAITDIPLSDEPKVGIEYKDENLGRTTRGEPIMLSYAYDFGDLWMSKRSFKMISNPNKLTDKSVYQDTILQIKTSAKNANQVDTKINSIQYQGVLALHLLNRIILMNRFDILKQIGERIINRYFDMSNVLASIRDKRAFLKDYLNETTIKKIKDNELDDVVKGIVNYSYFLAPYEGIFINENIVGVIKVLASTILGKKDSEIKKVLLDTQDETLDFRRQKIAIREKNSHLYKDHTKVTDKTNYETYENILRNTKVLDEIYDLNKKGYSSQNIFIYNKPLISSVLSQFTKQRKLNETNIIPVNDYKIFYLFNNSQIEKCEHQYKLLENTRSLIRAVEN